MSLVDEAATCGNLCPAPTPALLTRSQGRRPLLSALVKLYNAFTELYVRKLFGQGHICLGAEADEGRLTPARRPCGAGTQNSSVVLVRA